MIALAAVPGAGSFAYLASKPVRDNRLLLRLVADAALQTLPWHLYERTGLRRLVARPAVATLPAAGISATPPEASTALIQTAQAHAAVRLREPVAAAPEYR